jgi:hypothetical protein
VVTFVIVWILFNFYKKFACFLLSCSRSRSEYLSSSFCFWRPVPVFLRGFSLCPSPPPASFGFVVCEQERVPVVFLVLVLQLPALVFHFESRSCARSGSVFVLATDPFCVYHRFRFPDRSSVCTQGCWLPPPEITGQLFPQQICHRCFISLVQVPSVGVAAQRLARSCFSSAVLVAAGIRSVFGHDLTCILLWFRCVSVFLIQFWGLISFIYLCDLSQVKRETHQVEF